MDQLESMKTDQSHLIEFQRMLIDHIALALMVVDTSGRIIYINSSFEEYHKVRAEDVIGRHVSEVVENSRMHIVARTGMAEHDAFQDIHDRPTVVSRIPLFDGKTCVGAVGMIRYQYVEEANELTRRIESLKNELQRVREVKSASADTEYTFDSILASAPLIEHAKESAVRASRTDATVLLCGESGVGKEVFGQSIHNGSRRRNGPFIRLNCSAIHENLIEAELFGYKPGAFTGASSKGRKGKFELADGGSIFLDEIGDMPLHAQVKLLRVIQEGEFYPLGSETPVRSNVRIIAATHRNLGEMSREGTFREDLYYRLNVIPIYIPPLREIPESIPELAKRFWERLSTKHGIFHRELTREAIRELEIHPWKGNVRELQNVLERILVMARHTHIDANDIRRVLQQGEVRNLLDAEHQGEDPVGLKGLIERTERHAVSAALAAASGNKSEAARALRISRPLLYKKMKLYGLE